MHVIFVNYHHFIDASGIHIFFLANELKKLGVSSTVCIPTHAQKANQFGEPDFEVKLYEDMIKLPVWRRLILKAKDPIVHAWTPRENVRQMTEKLCRALRCDYYVHLEDNEEAILRNETGMPASDLARLPPATLARSLRSDIIHPSHYKDFLSGAIGISCIFETLTEFVPPRIPNFAFWPACEPEFYKMSSHPDINGRKQLGLSADEFVIGYTGNMHLANADEITEMYRAIGLANQQGVGTRLIRTGNNFCPFKADVREIQSKYVVELGSRSSYEIRQFIAMTDALVQPGGANDFNNYRFPSKLPMYLASSKPVILPLTNIGAYLTDGVNCLLTHNGGADELADRIVLLSSDPDLRARLGARGREFARDNFSWSRSAKALLEFYEQTRLS